MENQNTETESNLRRHIPEERRDEVDLEFRPPAPARSTTEAELDRMAWYLHEDSWGVRGLV